MRQTILLMAALAAVAQAQIAVRGAIRFVGSDSNQPVGQNSGPVTSTQALLSYTAPTSGTVCTVEISESPAYAPLVHDVDPALFPGANLDSRASGVGTGTTSRVFVVGSRLPALGLDGVTVYSRSLQANTAHYFRVTCGASVTTGTFTTANIPTGDTFNEPPPADPSHPGGWILPTTDGTRTQMVVDPQKGSLLSPVSLQSDRWVGDTFASQGNSLGDGADTHVCNTAPKTDGSGNVGYPCNFNAQSGWNSFWFIVPSTGESRSLGLIDFSAPGMTVDNNLHAYRPSGGTTTRYNYIGNYAARVGGFPGAAQFDGGTTYNSVTVESLMTNFDATFNGSLYGCDPVWAEVGQYKSVKCLRAGASQDAYGWIGFFYGGDGRVVPASCSGGDTECPRIVAAWYLYDKQPTKFCGVHETTLVPGTNVVQVNFHGLGTNGGETAIGKARISTMIVSGITAGTNAVTVTGAPASQASGGDSVTAPTVTAGDRFDVVGTSNSGMVIASVSGNNWTTTANFSQTYGAGTIQMACNAPPSQSDGVWAIGYWAPLADVHGSDLTNATVVLDHVFPGGGHQDTGTKARVAETPGGWGFVSYVPGALLASLNQTVIEIPGSPTYNGVAIPFSGVLATRHPSYQQTDGSSWFLDRTAFNGGACCSGSGGNFYSRTTSDFSTLGATLVSGSLWQYFPDTSYPLARKLVATQATNGGKALRDISSPTTGNVIGTTGGDNFKYCTAYKANECRTGSVAGAVYFNVPALTYPYCKSSLGPIPTELDVCITNMPAYSGALMQLYMGSDGVDSQSKSRNLTNGLVGPKGVYVYPVAKALPNASYGLFTLGTIISSVGAIDVWKVKIPPLPALDSWDRTKYIPMPVLVAAGSQNNVVVKFWYAENGYCTSRAEDCYAVAATVPAEPFKFPSDGASGTLATVTGLSCASGCTVAVPGISGHVMYLQKIYRDSANNTVATGPIEVTAVP